MSRTGADLLCETLEGLGVEVVFGLPGTQNVPLFEALRASRLRTVVASHELGAAFMANGYARASGRVGVVCTIPGPGYTYALTALAEARHDSVPLVLITGTPAEVPGRRFAFQALDQRGMAAPVTKAALRIGSAAELRSRLAEAFALAASGEPGPVLVEVAPGAVTDAAPLRGEVGRWAPDAAAAGAAATELLRRLGAARRPFILAGQGTASGAVALRRVVERLECPVATTLSGRGVLPEDHPLLLALDMGSDAVHVLNEAIASADLVLAVGCKFTHNGSGGFRLALPAERLVHLDASSEVAGVNYPASRAIVADGPSVLALLADGPLERSAWTRGEVGAFRQRGREARGAGQAEPLVQGATPEEFFESLRRLLPAEAILVTDSGLHQVLARRYWQVLTPRGFIAPSDFQSMGFGIPAGIGAALAAGARPVVVVTGDGGFNMAGLELLTAVRDRIPLTTVVFNDGHYGLIRLQQMGDYGRTHGVAVRNPDYAAVATGIGAEYRLADRDAAAVVAAMVARRGVALVEVPVGDSAAMRRLQAGSLARETAHRAIPTRVLNWLKRRGR